MSVKVHDRDNEYPVVARLIDDAIREAAGSATSRTLRNWRPCLRMLLDSQERLPHLCCESVSKSFAFLVVVSHSLDEFPPGDIEEFNFHGRACRSISLKTSML